MEDSAPRPRLLANSLNRQGFGRALGATAGAIGDYLGAHCGLTAGKLRANCGQIGAKLRRLARLAADYPRF